MVHSLFGYLILVVILTIVPVLIGIPWNDIRVKEDRAGQLLSSFVMGTIVMLAIFELCVMPAAIFYIPFNVVVVIYSAMLIIVCVYSVLYLRRTCFIGLMCNMKRPVWTKYEIIYFVIFVLLLGYQLYYAIFYSRTYFADDGYVAYSSAAYADNYIALTSEDRGEYIVHNANWVRRAVQGFNYVVAYFSVISGVNTAVIAHTVIYVFVVVLAYSTYYVMACQIFKSRDNRLIFLSLVSILFIWGYHSHYSLTFRLLGPNDSGKAVLAVVLAPYMMTVMHRILEVGYERRLGVQIMILSIAACSLTLGGVYTFAALLTGIEVLYIVKKSISKKESTGGSVTKCLLYLLWGGAFPLMCAMAYLIFKYNVF